MRDALTYRPRPTVQHPVSYSQLQQPLQNHHISRCSHHTTHGPASELTTRSTASTVTGQGHRDPVSKVDTNAATYSHLRSASRRIQGTKFVGREPTVATLNVQLSDRPTIQIIQRCTYCVHRSTRRTAGRLPYSVRRAHHISDVHFSNSSSRSH
jgi:hypothetical protein